MTSGRPASGVAAYDPKVDEVTREALLRFTPEQHAELDRVAALAGVTKYAIVRRAVVAGDPRG